MRITTTLTAVAAATVMAFRRPQCRPTNARTAKSSSSSAM